MESNKINGKGGRRVNNVGKQESARERESVSGRLQWSAVEDLKREDFFFTGAHGSWTIFMEVGPICKRSQINNCSFTYT